MARDPQRYLLIAQSLLAGKIKNSRTVLLRAARDSHSEADRSALVAAAQHLSASLRTLKTALNLDSARGVEGDAARTYFQALPLMLKPELRASFPFETRNRRPPRDALNAVLSFLYAVLTNECRGALESVGLDPQVGALHVMRPGRPALALDLIEELRAIICDRIALTLINRGQLKAKDFRASDGGAVELANDARKLILSTWQERKRDLVRHLILDADVPIGLLPQIQARLLARVVRGELETYIPYVHR
jgi:CRISP-associated protein Cas1